MSHQYEIIGAPFGFSGNMAGTSEAPVFLRQNGLNSRLGIRKTRWNANIKDSGDVIVSKEIEDLLDSNEVECAIALYCQSLYSKVLQSYNSNHTPIIIGGDHSISIATIAAAASFLREQFESDKLGVVWVDSHADLSDWSHGNIHGKIAASLLGYGAHDSLVQFGGYSPKLKPENLVYIGVNDLMPNEHRLIENEGIQVYGADIVESHGIHEVIEEVLRKSVV